MKKPYEDPALIIELFPGPDIIAFSAGHGGEGGNGDDEDEPILGGLGGDFGLDA